MTVYNVFGAKRNTLAAMFPNRHWYYGPHTHTPDQCRDDENLREYTMTDT
jgi:hypothetical protein